MSHSHSLLLQMVGMGGTGPSETELDKSQWTQGSLGGERGRVPPEKSFRAARVIQRQLGLRSSGSFGFTTNSLKVFF